MKITPQNDPPWFMHTNLKTVLKSTSSDIWSESKLNNFSSKLVRFSKYITNANISAPVRDHPSKLSLGGKPDKPTRFYYSGFISELQRFFRHIMNILNLNSFGALKLPIGFALQINWTANVMNQQVIRKICKWRTIYFLTASCPNHSSIILLSINFIIFNFGRLKEDVRIGLPSGWRKEVGEERCFMKYRFSSSLMCCNNHECKLVVFVLACVSGIIRLQKAEPGHYLFWMSRDPVRHLSLRNVFYLLLATCHSSLFVLAFISGFY